MINVKYNRLVFRYHLSDQQEQPVKHLPVILQYYNINSLSWINLLEADIINSTLDVTYSLFERDNIRKKPSPPSLIEPALSFRLIPARPYYGLSKQEVLSCMYNIISDSESAEVIIHFGHHYIISSVLAASSYSDWPFTLITAPFPMPFDNPAAIISEIQMHNATLQKNLEQCRQQVQSADTEIRNLSNQLNEHQHQLERLIQDKAALAELNKQIMMDLEKCNSIIDQANKERDELHNKLSLLDKEYANYQKEWKESDIRFQQMMAQHEADVYTLKQQMNDLIQKLSEKELAIQELNKLKQELDDNILNKNNIIRDLNEKIDYLTALNNQYTDEINKLKQESNSNTEGRDASHKPTSLGNVYKEIVQNIDIFEQYNNTGYKLSGLRMKLRGMVDVNQGNLNIQFLEPSGTKDIPIEAISEIELSIDSREKIETPSSGTMPNVLNLTETAVRRILRSMNLTLNTVYQVNRAVPHGLSFKQAPEPGMPVSPQQHVTVVFSRNE